MNSKKVLLGSVIFLFLLAGIAFADDITACGDYNTSNKAYVLTQDIGATGRCLFIGGNNVTIDCQGHTIQFANGSANYGIYVYNPKTDAVIKNCIIQQLGTATGGAGIYTWFGSRHLIYNNTITVNGTNTIGMNIAGTTNSVIDSNIVYTNASTYGIGIGTSPSNITVKNNLIVGWIQGPGAATGLYLSGATNCMYTNNTVFINGSAANYGVYLYANTSNATLVNTNITVTGSTTAYSIITAVNTGGNNRLIYNNSFGNVEWTDMGFRTLMTFKRPIGLDNNIFISNGSLRLNLTGIDGAINTPINVTLSGLTLAGVNKINHTDGLYWNKNGVLSNDCIAAGECHVFSYSGGVAAFSINYSVAGTYTLDNFTRGSFPVRLYAPDSINAGDNLTLQCGIANDNGSILDAPVNISMKFNESTQWIDTSETFSPAQVTPIYVFGDSISDGSPAWGSSPSSGSRAVSQINSSTAYWYDFYMNSNISFLNETNFQPFVQAVSGRTCNYSKTIFNASIPNNTAAIIGIGLNDISAGYGALATENCLETLYNESMLKNVEVMFISIYPHPTAAYCTNITAVNTWLIDFANTHENVTFINAFPKLVTNTTTCAMNSSMYSWDGLHPSDVGYKAIAEELWITMGRPLFNAYDAMTTPPSNHVSGYIDVSCSLDGTAITDQVYFNSSYEFEVQKVWADPFPIYQNGPANLNCELDPDANLTGISVSIEYRRTGDSTWIFGDSFDQPTYFGAIAYAIGDSITAGHPGYDPLYTTLNSTNNVTSSYEYWLDQLLFSNTSVINSTNQSVYNKGVGSQTCDQVAARIATDIQVDAQIIFVQCGINDLVGGSTVAEIEADYQGILDNISAAGIPAYPEFISMIPYYNDSYCSDILEINAWLRNKSRNSNDSFLYVDAYSYLSDGTACGRNLSLYADGVHPNKLGYERMAHAVWDASGNLNVNRTFSYYIQNMPLNETNTTYDIRCNATDVSDYQTTLTNISGLQFVRSIYAIITAPANGTSFYGYNNTAINATFLYNDSYYGPSNETVCYANIASTPGEMFEEGAPALLDNCDHLDSLPPPGTPTGDYYLWFEVNNSGAIERDYVIFHYFDSVSIPACGNINTPGNYTVVANITGNMSNQMCINITANDVQLDGDGNTLTGDFFGVIGSPTANTTYGIRTFNVTNIEIKNFKIKNYSYGIYALGTPKAQNLSIHDNEVYGMIPTLSATIANSYLSGAMYVTAHNSSVFNNNFHDSMSGVRFLQDFNVSFYNNTISNITENGLILTQTTNFIIQNNTFNDVRRPIALFAASYQTMASYQDWIASNVISNNTCDGFPTYYGDGVSNIALSSPTCFVFYKNGQNITISGINFSSTGTPIHLFNVTNAAVENVEVYDSYDAITSINNTNVRFSNITFLTNPNAKTFNGIQLSNYFATNVSINGFTSISPWYNVIDFWYVTDLSYRDIYISGNMLKSNSSLGYFVLKFQSNITNSYGSNLTVVNANASPVYFRDQILNATLKDTYIQNVTLEDVSYGAITVQATSGLNITNFRMVNMSVPFKAIYMLASPQNVILDNITLEDSTVNRSIYMENGKNILISNSIFDGSGMANSYGAYISIMDNVTFSNTKFDGFTTGIYWPWSNVSLVGGHFCNNTYDLYPLTSGNRLIVFNASGVVLDRPNCDYTTYSNLTINDAFNGSTSWYQLNWTYHPGAPNNASIVSLGNKMFGINGTSFSIDQLIVYWAAADVLLVDENKTSILVYNGSVWIDMNATRSLATRSLTMADVTTSGTYGLFVFPNIYYGYAIGLGLITTASLLYYLRTRRG